MRKLSVALLTLFLLSACSTEPLKAPVADAGPVEVKAYILSVLQDNATVWTRLFKASGLQGPSVQILIVEQGQTFTSSCVTEKPDGSKAKISVDTNFPNAFYCGTDAQGEGLLIIPLGAFVSLFHGQIFNRSATGGGDFAAAVVIAHEYGHAVQDDLGAQLNWSPPKGKHAELLADCFSGVWTNSAYYEGRLKGGDFDQALTLLNAIGDFTYGGSHGTSAERKAAFLIGYNTGTPADCVVQYWPERV